MHSNGHDISYASDWSILSSRPIRSLRYIVACTRLRPQETRTVTGGSEVDQFLAPDHNNIFNTNCGQLYEVKKTCEINVFKSDLFVRFVSPVIPV